MKMMRNNRMDPDGRREKLCLVLSLFPFLFCQGHIRNRCFDLPLVILRRNVTTGSFSLYQRLDDPAAIQQAREELPVRRHLQSGDYGGLLRARREQTAARPNEHDDADTLALATMDLQERVIVNNVNRTSHVQEKGRRPTSLALKTRIFLSSSHKHLEEKDEEKTETCIICLGDLADGDRVGALPCSHAFHVACLKPWLQRCNACPTCKHEDVASSQFDESTEGILPLD